MAHGAVVHGSVPVTLARLGDHDVTGPDLVDADAAVDARPYPAATGQDEEHLATAVVVPVVARARREVNDGRPQPLGLALSRLVEPGVGGEVLPGGSRLGVLRSDESHQFGSLG